MELMRAVAALMIAPLFWLGIGTTEHVRAAAERAARGEERPAPTPPLRTQYAVAAEPVPFGHGSWRDPEVCPKGTTSGYDPDGIRWLKSVGATVTTYLVDRNQAYQQVLEDRVAGAVTATYVYLDDLVAAGFPGSGITNRTNGN